MKNRWLIFFVSMLFVFFATIILDFSSVMAERNSSGKNNIFPVFDAIFYPKKPNLVEDFGFTKIQLIYARHLWPKGTEFDAAAGIPEEPDEATIRQLARTLTGDSPVCLDIEHWPVAGDEATVLKSIKKLSKIVDWMHQENPGLKVGYYGLFPSRSYRVVYNYKKAIASRGTKDWSLWKDKFEQIKKDYENWLANNERGKELASHVDFISPSFYTGSDDTEPWEIFATVALDETKQYHKPVYPFLWPQIHPSNKKLAGMFLSGSFWKLELETCRKYANGIVIWSSSSGPQWQADADWWLETEKFMNELKKDMTASSTLRIDGGRGGYGRGPRSSRR